VRKTVGEAKTDESLRLFTTPALGHSYGGAGCDVFDKLVGLDRWVVTGDTPERIAASKVQAGKVVRTDPLCVYPKFARYQGSGDLNDAANFACVNR